MFNEFTEKDIYNIIIIVFAIIGCLYTIKDKNVPQQYTIIAAFCTFKMIFNYRKCTFSKLECKLRKVKREDGILSSFLDHVVDLRETKYKYVLYTLCAIFLVFTKNRNLINDNFKNNFFNNG